MRYYVNVSQEAVYKERLNYCIEVPDGTEDIRSYIDKTVKAQEYMANGIGIVDTHLNEQYQEGEAYGFDIREHTIKKGGYDR